jgi:release factor glutamine methyltransferase
MDTQAPHWQQLIIQSGLIRSEAWILACHISKHDYAYLRSRDDEPVESSVVNHFVALSEQRLKGVPIAYLVNERDFYGRSFFVDERVLIPRHETEQLIDIVLRLLKQDHKAAMPLSLLDLGTGSGIIPITLALEMKGQLSCIGVDISTEALAVAQLNQTRLQNQNTSPLDCQWLQSNWFDALGSLTPTTRPNTLFDAITSNPPYIAASDPHLQQGDLRFEPRHALSDEIDGLAAYRTITSQASNYLKPGAYLVLEHGYAQAQDIHDLFKLYPHWQNIQTEQDLSGLDRCTYAQYAPE